MNNLLLNSNFEAGRWLPVPGASGDAPLGWFAFYRHDAGRGKIPWDPGNSTGYVAPEYKPIEEKPPYLNPPRGRWEVGGRWAWCWFGFMKHLDSGLFQRVAVEPGTRVRFSIWAHAWSNSGDGAVSGVHANDPKWSDGVGFGAHRFEAEAAWPNLAFTGDPQQDARQNVVLQVGLDPLGGTDPKAEAMVWSAPTCIYNVFDQLALEAIAANDHVTVYVRARSLWGFQHNDVYVDDAALEIAEEPTPRPGRGAPRVQYTRVYHVIPQSATPQRAAAIAATAWAEGKCTAGGSYDDAGVGDLDSRRAVLWDIASAEMQAYRDWFALHYPGVTIEFRPKVDPPSPPALTANKGGLHIVVQGSHHGYEDYLRRCAEAGRPVGLIKVMKDGGAAQLAKEISSKTITVWRWFSGKDYEDDTPAGNWQWPASSSRQVARDWMKWLYLIWEPDRQWVDFYEFLNEPDPADQYGIERAAELVQYCMEDAEAHGFKTAIWSWTAGLPRTPTIHAGDFPQAEAILETLKWAAEHGHAFAVHDGSVNDERRLLRQGYEDKTALRYRYVKALMDQRGWPMPYVVITEAYQVDGYRKPDWDDWKWYLRELGRDDYVLGCAWFTLGDYEFSPGQSVNVAAQLPGFAQACIEASTPTDPQPPPPPPQPYDLVTGVGAGDLMIPTPSHVNAIRTSKVGAIKVLALPDPDENRAMVRILRQGLPRLDIWARLFFAPDVDNKTRFTPAMFVETIRGAALALYAEGVREFEVHNEPNLVQEGCFWNWRNGAEFGVWFLEVLGTLGILMPEASFGFPGLSPGDAIEGTRIEAVQFAHQAVAAINAADWIGAHSYWQYADDQHWGMSSRDGGLAWLALAERFPDKPLVITEFSNNLSGASLSDKGKQYKAYFNLLRSSKRVRAAFSFALSWSSDWAGEAWVKQDGTITPIPSEVGA